MLSGLIVKLELVVVPPVVELEVVLEADTVSDLLEAEELLELLPELDEELPELPQPANNVPTIAAHITNDTTFFFILASFIFGLMYLYAWGCPSAYTKRIL